MTRVAACWIGNHGDGLSPTTKPAAANSAGCNTLLNRGPAIGGEQG